MKRKGSISLAHRLLSPRVTYLVTTVDRAGLPTIATITYLIPVSEKPERVAFAITNDTQTYSNLRDTANFVVNVPTVELLDQIWKAGGHMMDEELHGYSNKICAVGLSPLLSLVVKSPRIAECCAHIECMVNQIMLVGDHHLALGDVVATSFESRAYTQEHILKPQTPILLQISGSKFTTQGRRIEANLQPPSAQVEIKGEQE